MQSLTTHEVDLLNRATPGTNRAKLGDKVSALANGTQAATTATAGVVKQGVSVPNAAGANPTQAEFNALLTSLRNAGLIAP